MKLSSIFIIYSVFINTNEIQDKQINIKRRELLQEKKSCREGLLHSATRKKSV